MKNWFNFSGIDVPFYVLLEICQHDLFPWEWIRLLSLNRALRRFALTDPRLTQAMVHFFWQNGRSDAPDRTIFSSTFAASSCATLKKLFEYHRKFWEGQPLSRRVWGDPYCCPSVLAFHEGNEDLMNCLLRRYVDRKAPLPSSLSLGFMPSLPLSSKTAGVLSELLARRSLATLDLNFRDVERELRCGAPPSLVVSRWLTEFSEHCAQLVAQGLARSIGLRSLTIREAALSDIILFHLACALSQKQINLPSDDVSGVQPDNCDALFRLRLLKCSGVTSKGVDYLIRACRAAISNRETLLHSDVRPLYFLLDFSGSVSPPQLDILKHQPCVDHRGDIAWEIAPYPPTIGIIDAKEIQFSIN